MNQGWKISICGLNCASYDFYKAGQGDKKKQQEIINWFKQDHGKTITPEQTMCHGCRGPDKPHWSPDCELRKCATEKRYNYCSQCPEFICTKLEDFASDGHSNHREAVENLIKIKEMGYEAWIKTRA